MSVVLQTGPTQGTLNLNGDGSFTYSPMGLVAQDSFTYVVTDGISNSAVATVNLSGQFFSIAVTTLVDSSPGLDGQCSLREAI